MPRRAKRDLMNCLCSRMSTTSVERGKHARRGVDLVADAGSRRCSQRQINVDARSEADKTETVAARQMLTGLRVAENAPSDQSRDLHAHDVRTVRSLEPHRG